jgi:hypothetical protein
MRLVMVIDERDGAGDFAGIGSLAILDELGTDAGDEGSATSGIGQSHSLTKEHGQTPKDQKH